MFSCSSQWLCRRLSFHFRRVQFAPLPEKAATGGEDAYVSLANVQCVLDGVSWWRCNAHVDAGLYSAALARSMYTLVEETLDGDAPSCSFQLLRSAYEACAHSDVLGTSTALVAMLQSSMPDWVSQYGYRVVPLPASSTDGASAAAAPAGPLLDIASIGDCTLMVLRDGDVVYATSEQLHNMDYPYQLGSGSKDTPADSVRVLLPVRKGDVVVLGTDGIFDNLYQSRIAELLWPPLAAAYARAGFVTAPEASRAASTTGCVGANGACAVTAARFTAASAAPSARATPSLLGVRARMGEVITAALDLGMKRVMQEALLVSKDVHCDSPYATKCLEDGALYEGGKPDDMTLLVSVLDDCDEYAMGERVVRDGESLYPMPYRDWP